MRFLLLTLFAVQALVAADATAGRQLDELKKAFPQHTSGQVTDKSDPLIVECFTKYQKAVDALTAETLAKGVSKLRKDLETEIRHYELRNSDRGQSDPYWKNKVMTPSMRHAIEQNVAWLKSKLRPYVSRLESLQRGRPQG